MWVGIGELAEAKPVEPGQRARALLFLGKPDQLERQPRIIERRTPRQQAILLEHGRDAAAEMVKVGVRALVADADGAFRRRFEADHQVEERGLAATGLADDRHDFARRNGQVEPVDRDHGLPGGGLPENLAQARDVDWRRSARARFHARHRSSRISTLATMASSRNKRATRTIVQANTSATENNSCATDN